MRTLKTLELGINRFNNLPKKDQDWVLNNYFSRNATSKSECPTVFISHSHKDKQYVRNLSSRLIRKGINVWLDESEIMYGESLIEKIGVAIDKTDIFLIILSPFSLESNWVKKELDLAMNIEIKKRKVVVIPVLIKNCPLPIFLKGKLYADFTNNHKSKKYFNKLVYSIYSHSEKKPIVNELLRSYLNNLRKLKLV